ncbi:MAG: tetratricopeptide repeat protein [Chloroflexi bacterium]|nr:tetratricopeptide repeat protein [Chloroflexota bacterium]
MSAGTSQWDTRIPRTTGAIPRHHLLATLQQVLDHKLTLICAPPGYGKTTLVAQFAAQTPEAVAWLSLEERDRDLPNLHSQSLSALEVAAPGIDSLAAIPGFDPGELATLVADYLRQNTSRPLILVVDDIQAITGSSAAELWLQTLVERLPINVHLVLSGRVLPNLPLTEMIARGDVLAFGQDQLRFSPQEIHDLAHEMLGVVRSMSEVEHLAERLEGWPAGTVLALQPLPTELEQLILSGGSGPEALFDALAGSMLEAQPPGLRDFLLSSSTLTRMTPELCNTILHLSNSAHWLAEAQQRNLFLSRVSGGLMFHRLFRNFLQRQLREDNRELYLSLHTRAARWFQDNNQLEWAFEHYLAGGLDERAAQLADRVALTYFSQGKVETLLDWRDQLGQIGILAPNLLYNCARIHTDRYNYDEAEIALDEAQRGFGLAGDEFGPVRVALQGAFIALQRGDFRRAAVEAGQLANTVADQPDLRGNALKILGVANLRLGEGTSAVQYLEHALDYHRVDGDAYTLANVLQDLSVAYWHLGRFKEASAALQEVVALRRSLGSSSALASALNNLGYYFHHSGSYDQAINSFQEGLAVLARVPNKRVESGLLWSMGELQRDLGAFEEASRLFNRALALISGSDPYLRCAVLISASIMYRWWEQPQEAESLALKAGTLAGQHELALEAVTAQACLWAARTQLGQAADARRHLDGLITALRDQDAHSELAWANTLAATAALLSSDHPAVDAYLHCALDEARQIGTFQALVAEIGNTPLLETYVVQHAGKFGDLIGALKHLRAAQPIVRQPPRLRQVDPQMTYSLRVYTLGSEWVERDGEEVAPSEWRSTTAREIFYYLLFQGPESREQVCLEFWPDSSPQRVRSNFHTMLYRARQALGENVIIFDNGLYALEPDLDLWCDAHELERLVGEARLLPARDARTEALWRRAAGLYKGDFLPAWDADWAVNYREHLHEMYLETLIGLGQCAGARHDRREAIAAYRRALDVNPYREDVHRAIMLCFAELGEKTQVLAQLQKLQTLLDEELGLEPSDETVALARRLLE